MHAKFRMLLTFLFLAAIVASGPALASDKANDLVHAMIEAHGGMEKWASAPSISWREVVSRPQQDGTVGEVTVEQGPRRAYLEFPEMDMRLGWDGKRAWGQNWKMPAPPRFFALLNYYFLNLPWMTQDPGVHLSEVGTAKIFDDPTEYKTVKMTFGEGVGDTPDDYYILYIDPKTHRLHATEYIVTYEAILPEGVPSTPPAIMIFDEHTDVDGLIMPAHYTAYTKDTGAEYLSCKIDNYAFDKPFDTSLLAMPAGAQLDSSNP